MKRLPNLSSSVSGGAIPKSESKVWNKLGLCNLIPANRLTFGRVCCRGHGGHLGAEGGFQHTLSALLPPLREPSADRI